MNKNGILSGAVINDELTVLKTLLMDGESEIPCFYKMCFPGLCCLLSIISLPWLAYTLLNDDVYSKASIIQFTIVLGLLLFVSITGVASLILSLPSNFMKQSDLFGALKIKCKIYAL